MGHKISRKGIEVDKSKIEVIEKLPPPALVKGVHNFLCHFDSYRRFIRDFSKISKPLSTLLMQGLPFEFDGACANAFESLKEKLISALIILALDWELPFELMCDASHYAVGVFLGQKKNKVFYAI